MSQRLCWRCYAVNRAADARGPPAIYSFRGSLGFPQENRSANSRENENASEKLHVPVPYRRSDLRCAVIGSTWSCWGAWLIRNLFPGHAGLGVEEGRGWASRGGCIIVRKKRKNGQELAGAARPVRCVCVVVICDVRNPRQSETESPERRSSLNDCPHWESQSAGFGVGSNTRLLRGCRVVHRAREHALNRRTLRPTSDHSTKEAPKHGL